MLDAPFENNLDGLVIREKGHRSETQNQVVTQRQPL